MFAFRIFLDRETRARAVRDVNQSSILKTHVICLNDLFQTRLGLLGSARDTVSNLSGLKGVSDINNSQTRTEIGDGEKSA